MNHSPTITCCFLNNSVSIIQERTGYKRSIAYALRRGDRRPSGERLKILLELAAEYARQRLIRLGYSGVPLDDRMTVDMDRKLGFRQSKG